MPNNGTFQLNIVQPVSAPIIETISFDWYNPRYDPFGDDAVKRTKEVSGNVGVIRQTTKAKPRHRSLKGSGEGVVNASFKRLVSIWQGYDTTQTWHSKWWRFRDLYGMWWRVRPKTLKFEYEPGNPLGTFEFEFGVESAPNVFVTPCDP